MALSEFLLRLNNRSWERLWGKGTFRRSTLSQGPDGVIPPYHGMDSM